MVCLILAIATVNNKNNNNNIINQIEGAYYKLHAMYVQRITRISVEHDNVEIEVLFESISGAIRLTFSSLRRPTSTREQIACDHQTCQVGVKRVLPLFSYYCISLMTQFLVIHFVVIGNYRIESRF